MPESSTEATTRMGKCMPNTFALWDEGFPFRPNYPGAPCLIEPEMRVESTDGGWAVLPEQCLTCGRCAGDPPGDPWWYWVGTDPLAHRAIEPPKKEADR